MTRRTRSTIGPMLSSPAWSAVSGSSISSALAVLDRRRNRAGGQVPEAVDVLPGRGAVGVGDAAGADVEQQQVLRVLAVEAPLGQIERAGRLGAGRQPVTGVVGLDLADATGHDGRDRGDAAATRRPRATSCGGRPERPRSDPTLLPLSAYVSGTESAFADVARISAGTALRTYAHGRTPGFKIAPISKSRGTRQGWGISRPDW